MAKEQWTQEAVDKAIELAVAPYKKAIKIMMIGFALIALEIVIATVLILF